MHDFFISALSQSQHDLKSDHKREYFVLDLELSQTQHNTKINHQISFVYLPVS